jgi:ABC-type methionine transport system ATPase subunit
MSVLIAVEQVEKVFNLSDGGTYIALKGIDLEIKKGEFISLIGHSAAANLRCSIWWQVWICRQPDW